VGLYDSTPHFVAFGLASIRKPFLNYIARPVNAVVRHVRPTYPIPGLPPAVQTPQRAGVINQK